MKRLRQVFVGLQIIVFCIGFVFIAVPSTGFAQPKLPNRVAYRTVRIAMDHFRAGLLENHAAGEVVADGISQLHSISLMDVEMLGIWPPERSKKMHEDVWFSIQGSLRNLYPDYYRLLELEATVLAMRDSAIMSGKFKDLLLFEHPEFRESLRITKVQAERLGVIKKAVDGKLAEAVTATEKSIRLLLRQHYEKLRENLNDEQLDWWDEVVGEPLVLHDNTRLIDVTGEITPRQTLGYAKYDGDFRMKLQEVFYDEDGHLKPAEMHVNEAICISFLSALQQLPNEIDESKVAQIKQLLLQNMDVGFQEFTGGDRERMLQDPDFQYPAAIVKILSPMELRRLRQLEFQCLTGGEEITTYGLRWAKDNRRLSNGDWNKVTAAVNQVEQRIAEELRELSIKSRDVLHEAYVAFEQELTTAQIQALGLVTSEHDIAGWLTGAVKTDNIDETVRKLNSRRKL